MRTRNIAGRVTTALALITITSACSAASTDSAGGGGSGPTVRIAVGIDPSFAPIFLADAKGLFTKDGVNVRVVQFAKGGDGVDAIAGGQVQMAGNSATTTIGLIQQNPGLRGILVYERSGQYLKVVERKGVASPAQIKKVGVVPGLSEMAAIRFLRSKNIDPKTVKFVTAGPPEIPALMQKGTIDAYVLWEPWPAKGAQLGGKIVENTGDYGLSYVQWLIAGNTWLTGHEATAAKVAKAVAEAAKLTESDPQAAAEATRKATKIPDAQTLAAIKEIDFGVRDITAADLKDYGSIADYYLQTGKVKAKPDVSAAVIQGWFSQHAGK